MFISALKEFTDNEKRVALTPDSLKLFQRLGLEVLIEKGFDMDLKTEQETTVTYHDPCRLGRQIGLYEEPRNLIKDVGGVELVEMEHHGEDALCCGVSSMMACNENSRSVRLERFEEVRATGAEVMLTSCPKCVSHFECLKFEGDPTHNFEILDVVTFLARQVDEKKKNNDAIEANLTSLKTAEV